MAAGGNERFWLLTQQDGLPKPHSLQNKKKFSQNKLILMTL